MGKGFRCWACGKAEQRAKPKDKRGVSAGLEAQYPVAGAVESPSNCVFSACNPSKAAVLRLPRPETSANDAFTIARASRLQIVCRQNDLQFSRGHYRDRRTERLWKIERA